MIKIRKVMVLVVVLATVISVSVLLFGTRPALAVSFSASNVTIDSEDGTITEVTVAPSGTVTWNGLDSVPESMNVELFISSDISNKDVLVSVGTTTIAIAFENQSKSGSQGFSLDKVDIISNTSLVWYKSNFESGTDGGSNTVTGIRVKLEVEVNGKTTETEEATFDVTVNNLAGSVSVSGDANTGGS